VCRAFGVHFFLAHPVVAWTKRDACMYVYSTTTHSHWSTQYRDNCQPAENNHQTLSYCSLNSVWTLCCREDALDCLSTDRLVALSLAVLSLLIWMHEACRAVTASRCCPGIECNFCVNVLTILQCRPLTSVLYAFSQCLELPKSY